MGRERDGDPRPIIVGDGPEEVRAGFELDADAVRAMLLAPAFAEELDLLGISEPDRSELLAVVPAVAADPEILGAIVREANVLRRGAGLEAPASDIADRRAELDALQQRVLPGQGLIAILAHAVGTDIVRAWHAARGLTPAESWHALSDLGQQMRVHRLTFGELGHHTWSWTALDWAGRLFWLGRLQFDLSRAKADGRWVIGTHIPATGPLDPAEVDASFDAAEAFFLAHFPDLAAASSAGRPAFGTEFFCSSWLLSPQLAQILPPSSNLVGFQRRWTIDATERADDAAVFFVFHRRPPYELGELGTRTRLERGLVDRLASGEGWLGADGFLVRRQSATSPESSRE